MMLVLFFPSTCLLLYNFLACSDDIVSSSLRLFKHQQAFQAGGKLQCGPFRFYRLDNMSDKQLIEQCLISTYFFLDPLLKPLAHLENFPMSDPLMVNVHILTL